MIDYLLKNRQVKRVLGVSEYTLSQLSQSNLQKSSILYNPIPVKEKVNINYFSHRLAIIGDVVEYKGHRVLFKAMQSLPEDYELHVIGNLVDEEFLKILQSFSFKCIYTGMISNVADYLVENQISLVVIPSISPFETFSLSMTESWALGIPTLATDGYGMKELVESFLSLYRDDMLFTRGNEVELSEKILSLYSNKQLYQEISNAVYRVIKEVLDERIFREMLLKEISSIV